MMKQRYTLREDGFCAVWQEGGARREKAVIYLNGAGCGEAVSVEMSQYLVREGYSVLCLGYYLWQGMPRSMYGMPVEYVERAVKELKRNGYDRIAIHGISTGAGYALLCASLLPDITCVLAVVPYDYVMEGVAGGIRPVGCSVYRYRDRDVPCSRFSVLHGSLFRALLTWLRLPGAQCPGLMRYAYDTSEHAEQGRIRVERMSADVLLLGVRHDDCWPSDMAVPRMERHLRESGYPHRVRAVVYERGSHLIGCAEVPRQLRRVKNLLMPNERRYPDACAAARRDSQEQIVDFLRAW